MPTACGGRERGGAGLIRKWVFGFRILCIGFVYPHPHPATKLNFVIIVGRDRGSERERYRCVTDVHQRRRDAKFFPLAAAIYSTCSDERDLHVLIREMICLNSGLY